MALHAPRGPTPHPSANDAFAFAREARSMPRMSCVVFCTCRPSAEGPTTPSCSSATASVVSVFEDSVGAA